MSGDFCIKCDRELSVYCGPCMDDAHEALERAERERDTLIRMLVSEFGWEDTSYLHAMMHVENAVRNLRTDLSVAVKERDGYKLALKHTEDALKRHREERDEARKERDLYKTRLDHAEADAEQAVAILTAECDEAREQVAMLRRALKTYYHECKCQHAEMDEVNRQAYAALRATDGLEDKP